jgi:hypothetical protein
LEVALGFLMLLQVSFLTKKYSAGRTMKRSDTLVNSLVHVSIAGRGEDLSTSGTGILPLLQFLMTLFVGLIMAPKAESFSAQGA